ncbi:MAG: hypothetical protein NT167_29530, partial [Verrucomicrobia bacterium]|nr:hypothetical protein [Verrucomicrobiota bacterium]
VISVGGIAKWNGSAWSALGSGVDNSVYALALSGSVLYAGGQFTYATNAGPSAVNVNYIAKWDGGAWSALGSGMNSYVSALALSGTDLYAGGDFTYATNAGPSTINANRIAKWDGTAWSVLGSGVSGRVYVVALSGSDLYAGGDFTTAGGVQANYIAKWSGSAWSAFGSGMDNSVWALALSGSNLYAGGNFATAGGVQANYIAKWNGSAWLALGSGVSGSVHSLLLSGSDLYVGGLFTYATNTGPSAVNVNYIAKWDGSAWSALGSGVSGWVYALALSGSDLYVGGQFTYATNGGPSTVNANGIAKWDGISWSALGSGMNGGVSALALWGTDLYAGGSFTTAGGESANYIAKWDGSVWSALGSGMSSSVYALAVSGSDLYAGGDFTYATNAGPSVVNANRIAKWDGNAWSALSTGMNAKLRALAVSGTDLYAGGYFTTAGGVSANFIAKWDGGAWSALGSGVRGGGREGGIFPAVAVYALAVSGTNLYAGGNFTTAGGKVSAYVAEANVSAARGQFSSLEHSPARGFGFTFSDATPGQYYLIQTSPSLAQDSWIDWLGFIYDEPIVITDPSALATSRKFYRVVWAP